MLGNKSTDSVLTASHYIKIYGIKSNKKKIRNFDKVAQRGSIQPTTEKTINYGKSDNIKEI